MRHAKPPTVEQKRRAIKVTRLVPAGVGHDRVFYEADVYETRFRIAWQAAHAYSDLLGLILDPAPSPASWPFSGLSETPSDRDRVVAATVIQWLGTNVGRAFLEDALAAPIEEGS